MTDLELDTSYGHYLPVAPADVLAGPVEVEVPRDREGSFEPQIVKKRRRRLTGVDEMVLVAGGLSEAEARMKADVRIPRQAAIKKHLDAIEGDSRTDDPADGFHGPPAPCPRWHEVSTDAFQSAFIDADTAFGNWFDSPAGPSCRPGRRLLAVQEEGPGPGGEGGHGEGPFHVS